MCIWWLDCCVMCSFDGFWLLLRWIYGTTSAPRSYIIKQEIGKQYPPTNLLPRYTVFPPQVKPLNEFWPGTSRRIIFHPIHYFPEANTTNVHPVKVTKLLLIDTCIIRALKLDKGLQLLPNSMGFFGFKNPLQDFKKPLQRQTKENFTTIL
ncbi:hypothetical protein TNCV_1825581 [Trichonephila clavipes]|nr:hypothetical protein TNCV_1825581 [Trichonephila clavipes]